MDLLKNMLLSVVEVSVSTGVIVLLLLLFAPLFHKRYAVRWQYYIWIILAVRLVIPVNFSLPERGIEISIPPSASASVADISEDGIPVTVQTGRAVRNVSGLSVSFLDGLAVIWFMVFFCIMLVHICSYCHYKRKLMKSSKRVTDEAVRQQFLALKRELGIRKKITVIQCQKTEGPMVIGFFRTFLAIPEGVYSEEELFFIFRHELIHFRRHDTFFKFLFMAARALHWFNPVIAMMQKEAAIDMEFSCDEQVIRGISDKGRKAYTETLMRALERQYGKANVLTTQFNGGSRVMKKRFQNILGQSGRKRGFFLLVSVVCLTLVLGMMTGCTVAQTESPESLGGQENQAQNGSGEMQSQAAQEDSQNSGGRPVLSEDAMEISSVAADFSRAYFEGNQRELGKFLADSYDGDMEVYPDAEPELTGMTAVKGLENIGESGIGDTQTVSVECDMAGMGEGFRYLTLEMVKQEDGWKIYFYGLEM